MKIKTHFNRFYFAFHSICTIFVSKKRARRRPRADLLTPDTTENLKNAMQYVTLPDEKTRRASFYLAMEEYVARRAPRGDYFFCWQVGPSVVFGRNQVAAAEVDTAYCREKGIGMFRRKSGGGCIYADRGNVMLSFVTGGGDVALTFNRYVTTVVLMLRQMGIAASATGRNDIVVDGRKVSGSAFYRLPGRNIVHGTLLYDTDMGNMLHALTPPGDKLRSKGVESVRQRIALLKDYTGVGTDGLTAHMRRALCGGEYALTAEDVAAIERIEEDVYLSQAFIQGKDPRHTLVRRHRIDGAGCLEAHVEVKGGVIRSVELTGDFFATGDVEAALDSLKGVRMSREAVSAALPESAGGVIMNLGKEELVSLIVNA